MKKAKCGFQAVNLSFAEGALRVDSAVDISEEKGDSASDARAFDWRDSFRRAWRAVVDRAEDVAFAIGNGVCIGI
jgi:hypothetical protein